MSNRFVLVTGGARSGKSRFAERHVAELAPDGPWLYVATAEARDDEMRARIDAHRSRRGETWRTREAPLELAAAIADRDARAILVDCVTLWLSNLVLADLPDREILVKCDELADRSRSTPIPLVMVTNEVGDGIVPDNALARRYRDLAGVVNQRLAASAHDVYLVTVGIPLKLR